MKASEYRKQYQPTEHQIQQEIMNWLEMKGYYVQRMNSGKYALGEGASRRFVQGAKVGTPDVMALRRINIEAIGTQIIFPSVDLLFIEVKKPGNQPTQWQKQRMEELEEHGARCIVATCIEDVEKAL